MYTKRFCKHAVSLTHLPEFQKEPLLNNRRISYHFGASDRLKSTYLLLLDSIDEANRLGPDNICWFNIVANRLVDTAIEFSKQKMFALKRDPLLSSLPFNKKCTAKVDSSLILAIYNLLILCCARANLTVDKPSLFDERENSIFVLTKLMAKKGYCSWKYDDAKNLYDIPLGMDGCVFFLDELIALVANDNTVPYTNTRLKHIEQIKKNIKYGVPVPMYVCDNLYYNNSELTDGHYVILIGLEHDMATIVDSNSENGIVNIPALQLYSSAVADHSKTCIWDTDPIFHYHK